MALENPMDGGAWDSPVVETSSSNAGGLSSVPGQGVGIPHASQPRNQNIRWKRYCNSQYRLF